MYKNITAFSTIILFLCLTLHPLFSKLNAQSQNFDNSKSKSENSNVIQESSADKILNNKENNSSINKLKDDLQEIQPKIKTFKEPASEKKKKVKGVLAKDSPNLFAKWHNDIRTLPGMDRPNYPINYQVDELKKAKEMINTQSLGKVSSINGLNWKELGPGNVAGRTRSILVDPNDIDTWYVGSVGGGVWKTTDAGKNWTDLTSNLPNLATSALAWSESNLNIIYVGTGEGFGNVDQIDGSGIWKTTDGGSTWQQLISTTTNPEFENVMRLAVDPKNPDVVVAAVAPGFNYLGGSPSSGIYRSSDGGATWTKTYNAGNSNVEDLRANPLNFNTQFATINATGVIKSVDGGLTWFESDNGIGSVGRMELAIAPSDTNRIYIAAQGGAFGSILYSSADNGANWIGHADVDGKDVHWLAGQGWYDNTIAVNPYDENQVFVGGPQLWQLDITDQSDTSDFQITKIDVENISSFLWFVNWGGTYAGGGLDFGSNFHGLATSLTSDEFSTVEIRFGPGKSQKAHRFTFASGFQYPYLDYVDVPFEVWDIDNNKQLMVSFRDQDGSGTWNLSDRAHAPGGISREYVFINAVEYDAAVPDTNITKTAGMAYKNMYAFWPELPTGATFDPNNLPDATIRINWGTVLTNLLTTTNISDAYTPGAASKGIHVDHHNLVLVKTDAATESYRLLNGNDGGVAYSDDKGATFSQTGDAGRLNDPGDYPNELLLGYNTTQFYGIDKANGIDRYVGGMQDNGSWVSPENPDKKSVWVAAPSGDGYEAAWHYNDVNKIIETSQYNGIYRTLDGGNNWTYIGGLVDNGSGRAPFFTKIGKSKQDPDLIFAIGTSGVWRSDNFGTSFTLTEMPSGFVGTSSFSQIKISLHNPQIVWTAQSMTSSSGPFVSVDGGLTFNATNIYTDVSLGRISGFETHPFEDSTAYALLSTRGTPKILKTTNLGETWVDISGFGTGSKSTNGFPDVAVYSLLVLPFNTNVIFAGTEIGIFTSTDGGEHWGYSDFGFPPVAVYDMSVVNNKVVVATHGRGAWELTVLELTGYEPDAATLSPRFAEIKGGGGGNIKTDIILPSAYDSSFVLIDGEKFLSFNSNDSRIDTSLTLSLMVSDLDTASVSLISYKNNSVVKSAENQIVVFPLAEAQTTYSNNFNESTEDFVLSGLEVLTPEGFANGAIHSAHNYPDGQSFTSILKIPIIVADNNATIEYDDIAIVEPGEEGSVYGDSDFWDYVIVEGSSDNGATWIPLLDGYDSRFDQSWTDAYSNSESGDSTMFVSHSINILDTFNAGDKILIRFRLFADGNTNGWGWAIDNVVVQGNAVVGINDISNALPTTYSLEQNYPNPFNPSTIIKFGIPSESKVVLKIYDILGREVATLLNTKLAAGHHSINWNASKLSSGVYIYRIEAGNFVGIKKMLLVK